MSRIVVVENLSLDGSSTRRKTTTGVVIATYRQNDQAAGAVRSA